MHWHSDLNKLAHLESWPPGKTVYRHGMYMSATSLSDARWQACRWHVCKFYNMCRHVYTKSENYKHVIYTYRHGMYIVSYVHVYTMYRHGMYMFMTLRTNLTIHKHVHTMSRHVHTRLEDLLFVCQCIYMYRTCNIHVQTFHPMYILSWTVYVHVYNMFDFAFYFVSPGWLARGLGLAAAGCDSYSSTLVY